MPLELKSFRLPKEWGSSTDEDQNSPRLYLRNSIGLNLPISGGWGYSLEDCVIINKDDPSVDQKIPFDGVAIEYIFVEKRIYAELIVFRPLGDKFAQIEWKRTGQSLRVVDGRKIDVLEFRVRALVNRDWEFLRGDLEANNGYVEDHQGMERHLMERALRTCFYDTEYWFDITSFFGVHPVRFTPG